MVKIKEKERAIQLRRRGFSYNEILKEVPVAKSTLSLWLRDVGLAKRQKQRLTEKKKEAQRKGAEAKRQQRIYLTEKIKKEALKEIGKISNKSLRIIGTALYWAEGTKEKIYNQRTYSQGVQFGNSDPQMIKLFLKWIQKICGVSKKDISFTIFLHETAAGRKNQIRRYWAKITGLSLSQFDKIIWKRNKIKTKRKNTDENYYGLLKIVIRKSTNLNRKIAGWVEGICKNCGVV